MKKPDLQQLANWIDPNLIYLLEQRRLKNKEWHRRRKLGTLQTLWLMIAVSLDTQRSSLHEILSLATAKLNIQWSVSVAAFCKARAHFPPRRPILAPQSAGFKVAGGLQCRTGPLAGTSPIGC
jgi:hypothetical protein